VAARRCGHNACIAEPAWKRYEKQIGDVIRQRAQGPVEITPDAKLDGRLSGVTRQVDILVEGSFAGIADAVMAVDCKCFSEKVDVKDVEAFLGMLEDIGVHLGMLVTTVDFTPGAKRRAVKVVQEVVPLVDIVIFEETSSWWLMRAGQSGSYVGDYVDHEPYGKFWWVVRFVTGEPGDEEEDGLWSSTEGGWDAQEQGPRLLASILARHRLVRNPDPEEVDNLTRAIERNAGAGQGFYLTTGEIDDWIAGSYEDDEGPEYFPGHGR